MPNMPKAQLKQHQFNFRKQICEWFLTHDGWRSVVEMAADLGMCTNTLRHYILWLERKELLLVKREAAPVNRTYYQLAKPFDHILFDLEDDLHERENKSKSSFGDDEEHLAWMAKYRERFVARRLSANLPIPNFATEC